MPGIDPTPDELTAITDVATARAWCGVDDDYMAALEGALGGRVRTLRHLVLVDRVGWDHAMQNLHDREGNFPGPLWVATLESLRRVARIKCGLCPGDHREAV